jgi:hypothetical protein
MTRAQFGWPGVNSRLLNSAPAPVRGAFEPSIRRVKTVLRNVTDMDLRLLRIFSIVVKCGGLTAAQAELNMS